MRLIGLRLDLMGIPTSIGPVTCRSHEVNHRLVGCFSTRRLPKVLTTDTRQHEVVLDLCNLEGYFGAPEGASIDSAPRDSLLT